MNAILKNWWILTIKGLITFTLGLLVIFMKPDNLMLIAGIFALLLIFSGISMILLSIWNKRKFPDRDWKLTEGFIDLIIGLIIISFSSPDPGIFIALVTIWISFMGILQISSGYRMRGLFNHYWILVFNGLLAIGFTIIMYTHPVYELVTMIILIGLQASVFGSFLIISSIYIRKVFQDINIEIPHKFGEEANQELSYY